MAEVRRARFDLGPRRQLLDDGLRRREGLAAQLLGASATVRAGAGNRVMPFLVPMIAQAEESAIAALGAQRFEAEFKAGVDLSTDEFWDRMLAPDAPFPTTAAASPGDFQAAFEEELAAGAEAIVCVTVGSRLSATMKSAELAVKALPGREIHLVDSHSASLGVGLLALQAAELAATGLPQKFFEGAWARAVIMALGNRKAAADHLKIPARTLYHRVDQWAGRGKDYQLMLRYLEWRKRSSRHQQPGRRHQPDRHPVDRGRCAARRPGRSARRRACSSTRRTAPSSATTALITFASSSP